MLLDSNVLIYAANRPELKIEAMLVTGQCAVASVIRIVVYGFKDLQAAEKAALDVIFRSVRIHELTTPVADRAILIRQQRKMGLADAIIADTALEHDIPLVTRNVDDYKNVTGLVLINPFD